MTAQRDLFTPRLAWTYTEPAAYTVSVWDVDDDIDDGYWTVRAFQVSEAELPRVMQSMYGEGWDRMTILVERDGLLRVEEVLT